MATLPHQRSFWWNEAETVAGNSLDQPPQDSVSRLAKLWARSYSSPTDVADPAKYFREYLRMQEQDIDRDNHTLDGGGRSLM